MTAPVRPGEVNNLATYVSFGLTYVVGHTASAIARSDDPIVDLPGWLPRTLFFGGIVVSSLVATIAAMRGMRGVTGPEALTGRLLGLAWIVAFAGLTLLVTGLDMTLRSPDLQTILWPTGSAFMVGLIYIAEGAARRNILHFVLGVWLSLVATASLLVGTPAFFWILAVAGGSAYAIAAVLERRRLGQSLRMA